MTDSFSSFRTAAISCACRSPTFCCAATTTPAAADTLLATIDDDDDDDDDDDVSITADVSVDSAIFTRPFTCCRSPVGVGGRRGGDAVTPATISSLAHNDVLLNVFYKSRTPRRSFVCSSLLSFCSLSSSSSSSSSSSLSDLTRLLGPCSRSGVDGDVALRTPTQR